MNQKITYNGKDITKDIDISTLIMCDRLGGVLDNITLQYPVNEKESLDLGISKDDVLIITTDDYSSGKMHVDDFSLDTNRATINAISCSEGTKSIKSKIWRNVRLMEVIGDVAKNYGLEMKVYNIIDYTFDSISQIKETDMAMLDRICKRDGYSIKVDDGCLIVFNDDDMEKEKAVVTLKESEVRKNYIFKTKKECKNFTVSYFDTEKGLITHTATDDSVKVGVSKNKVEYLGNIDEAIRFSNAYLKNENKNAITGRLSFDYNPKISAGTVIQIEGFANYDGKYIVYAVTHNVTSKITTTEIRKVRQEVQP